MYKLIDKVEEDIDKLIEQKKLTYFRDWLFAIVIEFFYLTKERLDDLETRIIQTKNEEKGNYFIHTNLIAKRDLGIYEDEFQKIPCNIESKHYVVDTVAIFLPNNKELNEEEINISGYIDNGEKKDVKLKLIKNLGYLESLKKFYKLFEKNKVEWQYVPLDYFNCMYDIVLVNETDVGDISNIKYELGEIEKYAYRDYIPVWNVFSEPYEAELKPRPLNNRIVYEYIFSGDLPSELMLDIKDAKIHLLYRDKENKLRVHCDKKSKYSWRLYNIYQKIDFERYKGKKFPILSNRKIYITEKDKRHFNDFRMNNINEIRKYIRKFPCFKNIKILSMNRIDFFEKEHIRTHKFFIENEFSLKNNNTKMELVFSFHNEEHSILKVSFVLGIIESFFPEYDIVGKIVSEDSL